MKNPHVFQLLLTLTCLGLSACTGTQKSSKRSDNAPLVGGYSRSDDSSELAKAATFAAREESRRTGTPIRVARVVRGESQVVAGFNYRLQLIAQRNGATTETAKVVVFRDLSGHFHLTSWRWARR